MGALEIDFVDDMRVVASEAQRTGAAMVVHPYVYKRMCTCNLVDFVQVLGGRQPTFCGVVIDIVDDNEKLRREIQEA